VHSVLTDCGYLLLFISGIFWNIKRTGRHWIVQNANTGGNSDHEVGSASVKLFGGKWKKIFFFINGIFTLFFLIVAEAWLSFYAAWYVFESPGLSKEAHVILIKPGMGIHAIGTMLQRKGLIKHSHIFVHGVHWEKKDEKLKAGEYEIPAHASMRQIMDTLVLGCSIEYQFTVPEGSTVVQILERLASNEMLTGRLPGRLPPEGWLMTDTVKFVRGTSRVEIIRYLQDGQHRLVQEIWDGRDPGVPLKNVHELVTLASIVEKETGIASERPRVAAVFYNRLKKKIRLQSDATVLYGVFGGKGKPSDRLIYRSDLDMITPFNTYKITGLPPFPIANPGRASLKAVANPMYTDDLYFVANGTGGHVFSKTLDEHNRHVIRWRKLKKSQHASFEKSLK